TRPSARRRRRWIERLSGSRERLHDRAEGERREDHEPGGEDDDCDEQHRERRAVRAERPGGLGMCLLGRKRAAHRERREQRYEPAEVEADAAEVLGEGKRAVAGEGAAVVV